MAELLLGVNIDHIATLRNARGTAYPDPVQAAFIAEQAGADGITVHLREDRRHITDRDVRILRQTLDTRMNLEMAVTEEMLAIAVETKPHFCCLVPEKRQEVTTEGGLDVAGQRDKMRDACKRLAEAGIQVSLFIDADEEQIKAAADTLNQYAGAKITYDFGDEKEELDASEITDWFTVSDDMTVSVDEDKLASYVKELAASHNTAGQDKTLTMTGGGTVTVPGGSYGWKIDQAAEREQLLADIKSGQSVEREPEYSQRANSHGANDYGNTYVEINLTTQHLYFYKNGALVVSSDFVSGKVAADHDTPTGAYFVNSRETNRTLRGEDYESFVNYWMPFNGGVGMHDATWRSSFGGQIYLRGGSHGCINLPVSAAKTIYENIEVGDAVLVFQTAPTPDVSAPQVTPETIISEIDSIGPVTLESATIMATIRSQYNALSDEDKAKVTNYETFVADEAALSALQEGGQQQ